MVHNDLGLLGAAIEVADGGARGMRVTVTLAEGDRNSVSTLEKTLASYLFEAVVRVQ